MNPLFSIILPTYNSEEFILKCLDSVASQSFKDFEILVLDGDSTDKTLEMVNSYKDKFISLRVLSKKDKGVYDAMNNGVEHALGTWIYFLGSDDTLFNENILLNVKEALAEHQNLDVLYGNVHSDFYGGTYNEEFLNDDLARLNICHQSIFFNKKLFKKIGAFNLNYKILADWDHNIRWYFNKRIKKKYINLIVANFADGGLSAKGEDDCFLEVKNFKILKYGFGSLSFLELKRLIKIELEVLRENKNILKWTYLSVYLLVIRLRRKYQRIINS